MEPERGMRDEAQWIAAWSELPAGYALIPSTDYARLAKRGVPLRVLARDPRRVLVSRR
jgi:hypothetical protein